MKSQDLNQAGVKITSIKKELLIMRIKKSSGGLINTRDYKKKRKEVARMLTFINNRKCNA